MMKQFVSLLIVAVLSLYNAQPIDSFFPDIAGAGLVTFENPDLAGLATLNTTSDGSISDIFASQDLGGSQRLDEFNVGGDFFGVGDLIGGQEDVGGSAGGQTFQADPIPIINTYANGDVNLGQVANFQQDFQNNLLSIFD